MINYSISMFFSKIILFLVCSFVFGTSLYGQILVNFNPDSLQEVDKFYFSHLNKDNKLMLQEGEYFFIFDINVNIDSVKLIIKGEDNMVIPYNRYDGFFNFYLPKFEVTTFLFSYNLNGKNLLAKLYKKPLDIISSELPESFQIKDIFNNTIKKTNLIGNKCIFLISNDTRLFDAILSVTESCIGDSVIIIAMAGRNAEKVLEFRNKYNYYNFIFSSNSMLSLFPWIRDFNRPIINVIYISDKNLTLKYRHIIDDKFITEKNMASLKEYINNLIL
jgi:hypothetical protein